LLFSILGVNTNVNSRFNTRLHPKMAEEEMSATQLEINDISNKWASIRHLSREEVEAANLEPEWLAAYNKFHTEYDEDLARMMEVAERLQKVIERPQIQKKTLGQKRRDRWEVESKRVAARASKTKKKAE
jgi:hypothetical protein